MKYLIANWKMNSIDIEKWKNEFEDHYKDFKESIEIIVCPNFIDLSECSEKFINLITKKNETTLTISLYIIININVTANLNI